MVLAHICELHRELHCLSPMSDNCKFGNDREGFYFRETSRMRSFARIRPSRNGEITLPLPDIDKSCSIRDFLSLQTCILTLFAKRII